jgi:hypothetical protein
MLMKVLSPGTKAREKHTGFEGVITALMIETGDKTTYRLEGLSKDGAQGSIEWFEANRIEPIESVKSASDREEQKKLARVLAETITELFCPCDICARKRTSQRTH